MSTNEAPKSNEEQLINAPYEQLISIQERIASLENQIREIESDLPLNVSKSILHMKKEIQNLTEKTKLQHACETPYVYSEVLEKIGDFQRRIEWKVKDTVQNIIFDAPSQFEQSIESPRDENDSSVEFHRILSESLENLRSNTNTFFEEDKKSLNNLEEQINQIKFQAKASLNSPSKITSHISNEIELQQKQINDLERTLNQMPKLINNSRRITEKFSNLRQTKRVVQISNDQNNESSIENTSYPNNNIPDLSIPLSTLESEVQTTISSLQFDLENVLKRIEIVDQKSDENEKQIMKIADTQGKIAELLSDTEDNAISMLDKIDEFNSKLLIDLNSSSLEEVEKETRKKIRAFKKDISSFKSALSKREAIIAQNSRSTS